MSEKNSILTCPVCSGPLSYQNRALVCGQSHSFDLSSSGYVNLALNAKNNSGDNAEMVAARKRFLENGYYAPLKDKLGEIASGLLENGPESEKDIVFVDAGCGEGYYTSGIFAKLLAEGYRVRAAGFDLSKPAVKAAAKRRCGVEFAVASLFHMPVANDCADLVVNIFAPVCAEEFLRVLRPGGRLLAVVPGREHLFGLKSIVYDNPYFNEESVLSLPGLQKEKSVPVEYEISVNGPDDIKSLFSMTPYFWRTPPEGAARLSSLNRLQTPISFEIQVYIKPDVRVQPY